MHHYVTMVTCGPLVWGLMPVFDNKVEDVTAIVTPEIQFQTQKSRVGLIFYCKVSVLFIF